MKNALIPLLVLAFILTVPAALAEDEPTPIISGTISTSAKKPMPGVQVILLNQTGVQLATGVTGERGGFSFKHTLCRRCTLQILPNLDTHYACAVIENIPGDANRNFLLSLQRGFTVSGRVVSGKKGLKGVGLKATSLDPGAEGKKVYDGGLAITARNGTFTMILTPGHKKIELNNQKYSELEAITEMTTDVTGDATLPDIEIPETDHR